MKKALKKFLVSLLTAAMVIGSLTITAAAEGEEYVLTLAFGGDAAAEGDWGYGYTGPAGDNTEGIVGVDETIKVGETKTVSITLPSECVYTWYTAPLLIAENVTDLDVTVEVAVDGNPVDVDASAGDAWWYEATGNYSDKESIRLYGGYNEWGAHYIESPLFTTIEYTVTLNSITTGTAEVAESAYEGEFTSYLAFACNDDWGVYYYNPGNEAGVTQEPVTAKVGDTITLTATLDETCGYTWFLAPVLVVNDDAKISSLDCTVSASFDGEEAEIDFAAGDAWWYEATGDYDDTKAIRLAGGYNEWGAQYISSPVFTEVTYTITINSAMKADGDVAEEAPALDLAEFDANGTYNAYMCFQTPKYSFRNAWDEPNYGKSTDYFNQVTGWDSENNAIVIPGTFNDIQIAGNGTYTVSVEGLEFPDGEFDAQDYMNLIFVSTDIPRGAVEISDVSLSVNGSPVDLASVGALISPEDTDKNVTISIQNIWNPDITTIGYYSTPVKKMAVTFTVSGFAYDKAEEAPAEETPAEVEATPTEAPAAAATGDFNLFGQWWFWTAIGVVVVGAGAGVGVAVSKKKK